MHKLEKVFFIFALLIFAGNTCFAQVVPVKVDSVTLNQRKSGNKANGMNQKSNGIKNQQKNNPNAGGQQAIKQVKGARPDMSKARGARPPDIVRPSGSGIPRGMGKPGGAGRGVGR